MSQQIGIFEFQIKRGVINHEEIEELEVKKIIEDCKKLCQNKKNKDAVEKIFPILTFEMDWENCDGDPTEILLNPESNLIKCTIKNTDVKLGLQEKYLIITAVVEFEVPIREGLGLDEVQQWLDDYSAYAAGYISGGWGYLETDGDNLRIVKVKKK